MTRQRQLACLALCAIAACAQATSPGRHAGDVIYAIGEGPTLFVIDPQSGRVIAKPGPLPDWKRSPVLSSDSSTLFFSAIDRHQSAIFALDARTLEVHPWLPIKFPPRAVDDSIYLVGGQLAVSPGGGYLYDGDAVLNDTSSHGLGYNQRIAVIDTATREVTSSWGPIHSRFLIALPAGPFAPNGDLISFVSARSDHTLLGRLVVIDPTSGQAMDSLDVPLGEPESVDEELRVVLSPDGGRAYFTSFRGIYDYDLMTRRLVAFVSLPNFDTDIAVSPDGSRVYVISNPSSRIHLLLSPRDRTESDSAATSTPIRVFDASLVELPSIPFAGQRAQRNRPVILHRIVVSRDNAWIYATAGNGFREGKTRVLIINASTGRIAREIPLEVAGGLTLLVGR